MPPTHVANCHLGVSGAERWHHRQMPKLSQPILEVAWRHRGETGKIHYRLRRPDAPTRHLITRDGEALFEVLEQHLAAIGYTGPKSAAEDATEH